MKRILSFLLIAVLVFSLAGCAPKDEPAPEQDPVQDDTQDQEEQQDSAELVPEEGAELLIWESEDKMGEWLQEVGKAFEAKYGVTVKYEPVGSNDVKTKLPQDGPAGVGGDIFAVPHNDLGLLVSAGLVKENDKNPEMIQEEFVSAASEAATYQGVVYGYPLQVETYALFYNKDIFPEAPKSYDEIVAKAKEFNDPKNNQYAFMWDVKNSYYSHGILATFGGYIFGQGGTDKDDIGLDSDGAIEGAKAMLKLKEILPVNSVDAETQVMKGLFEEGKIGAVINGPWDVASAKDAGINLGIAPLPDMSNGKHQVSFSGTRLLLINSYTKYPNAARLFAEFATSQEMLLDRYGQTNALPPRKALMDDPAIKNDPLAAPFLQQADFAVPMPSIVQMEYVWGPYGDAFASIWDTDVTPEEALKNAAQVVREAIAAE